MNFSDYLDIKDKIIQRGFIDEIIWADTLEKCEDSESFFLEYLWVLLNSGMKNQIAETIYKKILKAISENVDISDVFRHKGKVAAIKKMMKDYKIVFAAYLKANDKLIFCETLSWIGGITKYHLAKNLGEEVIKPDRHLERIANRFNTNPFDLCKKLSRVSGDRQVTVDTVLWRAANLGLI